MVDMFFSIIFVKKGKMENKLNMKYNRRNFLEESSDMEGDSLNSGNFVSLKTLGSFVNFDRLIPIYSKFFIISI